MLKSPLTSVLKGFKNLSEHFQTQWRLAYGGNFSFLNFLSIISDSPHTRETETQKEMSNFAKLQSLNDKS
jgi:hypothetical protein